MTVLDLKTYKSIRSNLFVRIEVPEYRESAAAAYQPLVLRFSDRRESTTINDEEYLGLGQLMGITQTTSEIRPSSGELTITVSGIPNSSLYAVLHSKIKGAKVRVFRGLFNPLTSEWLPVNPNPLPRYRGFVNNYTLQEDYAVEGRTATNTIAFVCASAIDVLNNKYSGRKTNPTSHKRFYPGDRSMDRVPGLENAQFDFGAPK